MYFWKCVFCTCIFCSYIFCACIFWTFIRCTCVCVFAKCTLYLCEFISAAQPFYFAWTTVRVVPSKKKCFAAQWMHIFPRTAAPIESCKNFWLPHFWFELFSPRTTVTSQYVFALWPLYLVCDRALSFLQGLHFPTELCYKNFWPANHYFCTNCTSWADCVFSPRSSVATSQVVLQQTLAQNFQLVARPTALIIKLHQVFHRV